jgi:SAM-dependent methyltransferase
VVATDISSVAIVRAAEHAREADAAASVRIEWRHADLLIDPPERDAFDLVSAQFMQLPPDRRDRLFTALAASVRAGGTLLVVGHHPSDVTSGAHRPADPERFYTADDIAALLDASWTIVVNEARPRFVTTPEGREATIHDAVLLAVRQ